MYIYQSRRSENGWSAETRGRVLLLSTCAAWAALLIMAERPHRANAQTVGPNLVTDPTFSQYGVPTGAGGTITPTASFQFGTYTYASAAAAEASLVGWASTGYNFVWIPNSLPGGAGGTQWLTATGSEGVLTLYSIPQIETSLVSFLTSKMGYSGTAANFIGADSYYQTTNSAGVTIVGPGTAPITQTVTGLVSGREYQLSFAWAAAQQTNFSGTTDDNWIVSLGSQAFATASIPLASEGFSGWFETTFFYTATASSETLSFLAQSNIPAPPFTLLADVQLYQVPEPTSIAGLFTGLMGLLGLSRRRSGKGAKTKS